jgi:hypothetical protein
MTVRELIELLKTEDQDALVCISSDEEGNTIRPVTEPLGESLGMKGDWRNEIELIHPDDEDEFEDDEMFNVVVIYP